MGQLTFSGRSDGAGRLVLVDEEGREHTLAVDPRLRKALRADGTGTGTDRSGQLEIPMESTLRPRDIQARIRAGETAEAVAQAAGTSVEKIMAFAAPVLAERAHVAQRAQLSSVRRRGGESGARTLGEAVTAQLRAHGAGPDGVEWDAWRREDGRWTLTGAFSAGGRTGTATFAYDTRGNFVTVEDADGHWLVGDAPASAAGDPAGTRSGGQSGGRSGGDDLAAVRQRRLNAVPADELPLGADTIEMLADEGARPADTAQDLGEVGETLVDEPDVPGDADTAELPRAGDPGDPGDSGGDSHVEEPATKRSGKRRGRASVPSWDEIMFGGGKSD